MSISTTTTTTRKRKRDATVEWEDVVDEPSGLDVKKENIVKELQRHIPEASAFTALSKPLQEAICEACQITGWNDVISEKISYLVSWLEVLVELYFMW